MATIIFVLMIVSLLYVFALDIRQKVRQPIVGLKKRSRLPRR
jgi:hypothetical protein